MLTHYTGQIRFYYVSPRFHRIAACAVRRGLWNVFTYGGHHEESKSFENNFAGLRDSDLR